MAAKPREKPAPAPVSEAKAPPPFAETTTPREAAEPAAAPTTPQPRIVSVGPGGFLRQGPGELQQPIPPAPPRRLVPAKPSAEIANKTSLLDLNEKICKWPLGHPGEPDFHFCGEKVNPGFPYCVEHCGRAYQGAAAARHASPAPAFALWRPPGALSVVR